MDQAQKLPREGLLALAVVPRAQPVVEGSRPKTLRDWFDRYYVVIK